MAPRSGASGPPAASSYNDCKEEKEKKKIEDDTNNCRLPCNNSTKDGRHDTFSRNNIVDDAMATSAAHASYSIQRNSLICDTRSSVSDKDTKYKALRVNDYMGKAPSIKNTMDEDKASRVSSKAKAGRVKAYLMLVSSPLAAAVLDTASTASSGAAGTSSKAESPPVGGGIDRDLVNSLTYLTELWCSRRVSNLDYLLCLAYFAAREFGSPRYHPTVPWVLDFGADDGDRCVVTGVLCVMTGVRDAAVRHFNASLVYLSSFGGSLSGGYLYCSQPNPSPHLTTPPSSPQRWGSSLQGPHQEQIPPHEGGSAAGSHLPGAARRRTG